MGCGATKPSVTGPATRTTESRAQPPAAVNKPARDAPNPLALAPPSDALWDRGVHAALLRGLAECVYIKYTPGKAAPRKAPAWKVHVDKVNLWAGDGEVPEVKQAGSGWARLGSLTTSEVMAHFVKPLTAPHKCCLAQAFSRTPFGAEFISSLRKAQTGVGWLAEHSDALMGGVFRPAQYFVSHAWAGPFDDLAQRVYQDSRQRGGSAYYWVDVFAVSQHYTGAFGTSPDSKFESVIQQAQGVLCSMHPDSDPTAPKRAWCLLELASASMASKPIQLMLAAGEQQQRSEPGEVLPVPDIDVANASAGLESDRVAILGLVQQAYGTYGAANDRLQGLFTAAARSTALLRCISALRVFGERDVYGKHDGSTADEYVEAWAAQCDEEGDPLEATAHMVLQRSNAGDSARMMAYKADQTDEANAGIRDQALKLIEQGARVEMEEVASTWLTAGQTRLGLEVLAAAIRAPGNRVKRVAFENFVAEERGAMISLRSASSMSREYLLHLLRQEPPVQGLVVE
uniref:Uncharacterized protein n=1 Tax=Chlamydomonas leiostraca TaxID=1034604 RepID=A0A7S0RGZ8_9CHLO|mmetsp:Transcript_22646/g.57653  ORF Transcript_22646/g.57653 Transcript_22646/m.57653 type:complete len:515 (+) Transcript_22646:121-1665(+)